LDYELNTVYTVRSRFNVEQKFPETPIQKEMSESFNQSLLFCQKISKMTKKGSKDLFLDIGEIEAHWFRLLDTITKPLNVVNADCRLKQIDFPFFSRILTLFLKKSLQTMMSALPLATIMKKIVEDNGKDKFGDFKSIFMSMLDVTSYERNILGTANKLLEKDAFEREKELLKTRNLFADSKNIVLKENLIPQQQQLLHQQERKELSSINFIDDDANSRIPLLHKLLRKETHLIPKTDFGGHVDIKKIFLADNRIIGVPQSNKINKGTSRIGGLQSIEIFGKRNQTDSY